MPSATSTPQALWAAYTRAAAREAAANHECDATYAVYEAAVRKRVERAAESDTAHRAYLKALTDVAVVAAAEGIALNIPHLFTDKH